MIEISFFPLHLKTGTDPVSKTPCFPFSRAPGTHWTGNWMGRKSLWREKSCSAGIRTPAVQPVAIPDHYKINNNENKQTENYMEIMNT
jgi:hypothetical protein